MTANEMLFQCHLTLLTIKHDDWTRHQSKSCFSRKTESKLDVDLMFITVIKCA